MADSTAIVIFDREFAGTFLFLSVASGLFLVVILKAIIKQPDVGRPSKWTNN